MKEHEGGNIMENHLKCLNKKTDIPGVGAQNPCENAELGGANSAHVPIIWIALEKVEIYTYEKVNCGFCRYYCWSGLCISRKSPRCC